MSRRKWTKEEIEEYRKKSNSLLYFNKEDSNFLVPKEYGFGWTFNWGNPVSWIFILILFGVIIYRKFF